MARAHTAKSIIAAMVFMTLVAFAPSTVMGAVGWKSAVAVAMLGGLAAFLAAIMGEGWRTSLLLAVPLSLFTMLAVWSAPVAWAAAVVMAAAAFLRGYAANKGLHNALMTSVIALGFLVVQPPSSDTGWPAPLFAGAVMLGTILWVALVMYLARRWVHPPTLSGLDALRVIAFSVVLALMVGVATYLVVFFKLGHGGGWIILTIVVVFQPYLGAGLKKAGERALGTLLGFVIALIVGLVISGGPLLYLLGSACMVTASVVMMLGKPYWVFATFLTPAIVLFESAGATVTQVAIERLDATIVGVAATLLVMLALTPLSKYLQRRSSSASVTASSAGSP